MVSLRHPATRVLASSLIVQATLVISGPVAVRLLGVEGRGEAAFVFAAVLLASQVGPWGLPQACAYFIARGDVDPRGILDHYLGRYARQTLLAALVGTGALLAVASANDSLSSPRAEALVVFSAIGVVMMAVLVLSCLQGAQRFDALAVLQAIPGLNYSLAIVLLALFGHATVVLVLILNFSGWLLITVVGLWLLRREAPLPSKRLPSLWRLRTYGRRVLVSGTAPIDNLGIDQLAVGLLLTHHALGLYVIGLAFESGPVLVLLALTSVCTPTVASITDPMCQRAYCLRWLAIGTGVGLTAVVLTESVIGPILTPAFGEQAAAATDVARILVVAGLFLGLRRLAGGMLQGLGRPMAATYAEVSGLAVMMGSMVPLSQLWGVEGAGVALLLGGLVAFVVDVIMVLKPGSRASRESHAGSVRT